MFSITSKPIEHQKDSCPGCVRVRLEERLRPERFGRKIVSVSIEKCCEKLGNKIVDEAKEMCGLRDACCQKRVGTALPGEPAVVIQVSGDTSSQCMNACAFIHEELMSRAASEAVVTYEDGSEEKVVSTDIWHSADRPSGQPTLDTICWAVQDFSELKGWHIFDIRDDEEIAEEPLGLPADHTPFCSFNAETFQPCGDGWTLLVCRTGMRSYRMAAELRRKGHERIWSLQGGVVRLKVLAAQSQVS